MHSQLTSKVPENDLQYLSMTRSNLMFVFSGTVLGYFSRQNTCISFNITVVVDIFTEI